MHGIAFLNVYCAILFYQDYRNHAKSNGKNRCFFDRIETLLSQTFCYSATFSLVSGELVAGVMFDSACLSFVSVLAVSVLASAGLTLD